MGENGAAPADCPEGSFYRNADNMIVGCGTEDRLGVGPVEEGAMMPSGDPFPGRRLQADRRTVNPSPRATKTPAPIFRMTPTAALKAATVNRWRRRRRR